MNFARRHLFNILLIFTAAILLSQYLRIVDLALLSQQHYSGWLLFACISVLVLYGLRKRMVSLPAGEVRLWTQWHHYLGLFAAWTFLLHIEFAYPSGAANQVLAGLLVFCVVLGMAGALLNKVFSRRLAAHDLEVIYEQIHAYTHELQQRAEGIAIGAAEQSASTTLAKFYRDELAGFFSRPCHFTGHLVNRHDAFRDLISLLHHQKRYLNENEAALSSQLEQCMHEKHMLDGHYALQGALKFWSVLHIAAAYLLCVLTTLHVVLVYAFAG